VSVDAVVIVDEQGPELEGCLASLLPQVEELVVVANRSRPTVPERVRVVENERPAGFAANANRGIAETSAPFVVVANPDIRADEDAVEVLRRFAEAHPRCGIAGPKLLNSDGTHQGSRRRFPTVGGTIVRRTPLRRLFDPHRFQRAHYGLDETPTEPTPTDWLLGAFLFLRREMLDDLGGFDEGYRLYGEDIDLAYRAARAGWERWYVPEAQATHAHAAETDRTFLTRRTLWHWRGILRFVRKHPERLRAL
jgi:N-acetylglucosaminyl-diphospho-decaprenol L-rhamnosyltransferase